MDHFFRAGIKVKISFEIRLHLMIDVLAAYFTDFFLGFCMPHPVVPPALIMNAYQVAQLCTLLCVFPRSFSFLWPDVSNCTMGLNHF